MMQSLAVVRTGLEAEQAKMDVISNNLANVNTTGFKRMRPVFSDLLYQDPTQAGGIYLAGDELSFRPAARYRCQCRRDRADGHAGEPGADRKCSRYCDQRAGIFSDFVTVGSDCLYP